MSERTLSEHASKEILSRYGVPVTRELLVESAEAAAAAAEEIGFPVVVKLCGDGIDHKSERGLVRVGLEDGSTVRSVASEIWNRRRPEDGDVKLLVSEMVRGRRELIAGMLRDPQFGPCVMLGLGGVLTEALGDVVFAVSPVSLSEADHMIDGLRASRLITRPFRGEPAVDRNVLAAILVALGRLALEHDEVRGVDVNPIVLCGARPVAVDALVISEAHDEPTGGVRRRALAWGEQALERFRPLFNPRGIVVTGVSTHPGKFGFVAYHNLLRFGYRGKIFAVNRNGAEVLGKPTFREIYDVPAGKAELALVCTPPAVNASVLAACHRIGVRAAFVASGGYGEAGADGARLEEELVCKADSLGMVLAGPNGQGCVSTTPSMCAQIVPPYPPGGRIAIASQSGNIVSSLLNYAVLTGVGVSKSISCGNMGQITIADYLAYFAADPETEVVIAYLEGVGDGDRFVAAIRGLTARKPLIIIKGGIVAEGRRAAASHTGSIATDDRVLEGLCRQLGVTRAPTVEEAFEWAATFATQPLPNGRRVGILTSAGGWGVLAADACAAAGLELVDLPRDLREAIDALLPSRWSRANPVDLAGGETRDTIPTVLDLLAGHPGFDAIVYLGLGIQANQANTFRGGVYYPRFGLDRIVEFHERQDRRYGEAASEMRHRHGKPVLVASEQVYTDRGYGNTGTLAVRRAGSVCYPSAHRAVSALRVLVDYSAFRRRTRADS